MIFSSALLRSASGRSSLKFGTPLHEAAPGYSPVAPCLVFVRAHSTSQARPRKPLYLLAIYDLNISAAPRALGPVNRPRSASKLWGLHRRGRQVLPPDEELEVLPADRILRVQLQAGPERLVRLVVA